MEHCISYLIHLLVGEVLSGCYFKLSLPLSVFTLNYW